MLCFSATNLFSQKHLLQSMLAHVHQYNFIYRTIIFFRKKLDILINGVIEVPLTKTIVIHRNKY